MAATGDEATRPRTTRVVTRRGDGGETQLTPDQRGPKDASRIEASGAIDELGALLGLLRAAVTEDAALTSMLRDVQIDLFHVGASLYGVTPSGYAFDASLARVEDQLDTMNGAMPRLANFILAGGTQPAALAHLARTVARRAERRVVTLAREAPVEAGVLPYLNRLSDYLFVVARYLNGNGTQDDLWAPRGVR